MLPISKSAISHDRIRGTVDLPLSQRGIADLKEHFPALARKMPRRARVVILRPNLIRTQQTANLLRASLGTGIIRENNALRPWAQGKYEGQPTRSAKPDIIHYATKEPDTPIPGIGPFTGEPGQAFNDFKRKLLLGAILPAIQLTEEERDLYLFLVTHSRDIKVVKGWVQAGAPDDLKIDNSALGDTNDPPGAIFKLDGGRFHVIDVHAPGMLSPGLFLVRHGLTPWNGENYAAGESAPAVRTPVRRYRQAAEVVR